MENEHHDELELEQNLEPELEDEQQDEPPLEDDPEGGSTGDDSQVTALRKEAGNYRRQLRDVEARRDELELELYRERVAALGILADPADLEFDAEAMADPARLRELADELVTAKPHLRSRKIRERAGQGEGSGGDGFSLAGLLRQRA